MRFALMIEPQMEITWHQHVALAQRAEQVGFGTLYRSDHYDSFPGPPGRQTSDAFTTIAGLVRETGTLRHGTMVSPVTFRHPGNVAKVVSSIDEMSGGRIELGLGAGWNPEEHQRHAFEFYDLPTRVEMLEEQLQVVAGLWSGTPGWSFQGKHYQVADSRYAPLPVQRPRPPLITGTQAKAKGVRLAARLADHLNLYNATPDDAREAFALLDDVCAENGRDPAEVTRSVLLGTVLGADRAEADRRLDAIIDTFEYAGTTDEWRGEKDRMWLQGTPDDALGLAREFADAGADLIVLQDFLPYDLDHVDLLGAVAADWATAVPSPRA